MARKVSSGRPVATVAGIAKAFRVDPAAIELVSMLLAVDGGRSKVDEVSRAIRLEYPRYTPDQVTAVLDAAVAARIVRNDTVYLTLPPSEQDMRARETAKKNKQAARADQAARVKIGLIAWQRDQMQAARARKGKQAEQAEQAK